ncbi:MAG: ABC transporter permease [Ilumatobacteraceae bacterium]
MSATAAPAPPPTDERIAKVNPIRAFFSRPEAGAISGAIAIWLVFALYPVSQAGFLSPRGTASYLEVAAELGILAVPVALLMIGGEFDLSIGSVIGICGMVTAMLATEIGWNIWPALAVSLLVALVIGVLNGFIVVRTGLPSFIVTLATLFMVRGLTIAITRLVTGRTQIGKLKEAAGYDSAAFIFAKEISIGGITLPVSILWWIGLVILGTWLLQRTQFGNWIYGVGGNPQSARNVGVPDDKVKIILFMCTAASAWLLSTIQATTYGGTDVLRGENREFYAIIAAVIGGNLLTGGYGSVVGAAFGALIYGMIQQGVVYAGIDADWVQFFLGAMLLVAVLVNRAIRARAMGGK